MLCLHYRAAIETRGLEGTLFTYVHKPRPVGVLGTAFEGQPNYVFESDEFWLYYAKLYPNLSATQVTDLRTRILTLSRKVFSYENEYIEKWTIRITEGDPMTFESICRVYRKYHRSQIYTGNGGLLDFLRDRAQSIRDDLVVAKQFGEENPTHESEQQVRILQASLTQIEDRLRDMAAKDEQAYVKSLGSIAEKFMINPPNISASDYVR